MTRRVTRASRRAQQVLAEAGVTSARVPIDQIACEYATVVREPLDADVSGMLVPHPSDPSKPWIIFVNGAHPPTRQRFTLAHELGHLLLHDYKEPHADRGYVIRFRDGRSSEGRVREEIEANQFAAELLMPQDVLLEKLSAYRLEYVQFDDQDDPAIGELAKDFDVSRQALLIRLSNLLA